MDNIPSMWRTELWHPMIVHLPVVTLMLGTVSAIAALLVKSEKVTRFLKYFTILMIIIGVLSGWAAVYSGDMAYGVEVRKLCDPSVLQSHEWWGYITISMYSVALITFLLESGSKIFIRTVHMLRIVTLVCGFLCLIYTGHLGARVVYQQGGGTYKPSADCREF